MTTGYRIGSVRAASIGYPDRVGRATSCTYRKGADTATGETGSDDATFDLISVQYRSLKAGNAYGQFLRARNAGEDEIAQFFEQVMQQDSERAHNCPEFLGRLRDADNTSLRG